MLDNARWIFSLAIILGILLTGLDASAEVTEIRLQGGNGEFIELGTWTGYVLRCELRLSYDETHYNVVWRQNGREVYQWDSDSGIANAVHDFGRYVDTNSQSERYHLNFRRTHPDLTGNFSCQVSTETSSDSDNFFLHVVSIANREYDNSVRDMNAMQEELQSLTLAEEEAIFYSYGNEDEESGEDDAEEEEEDDPNCTLFWNFSTPAIFPKPSVRCGYYDYVSDNITTQLPLGLTLHQFTNRSWYAFFTNTKMGVADIPAEHRLGCKVSIPDTSYERTIKYEDGFKIDELLDQKGCPYIESYTGMVVDYENARKTCRGDVQQTLREEPALARVRCAPNHQPFYYQRLEHEGSYYTEEEDNLVVSDGSSEEEEEWELRLSCWGTEWEAMPEGDQLITFVRGGNHISVEDIPVCIPSSSISNLTPPIYTSLWLVTLCCFLAFTRERQA